MKDDINRSFIIKIWKA